MIIIEGPDNSGKSHLGKSLARDLKIPLEHSVKPDPAWTDLQALDNAIMQLIPQNIIRDRTYTLSEWVYGPICRGRSALGHLHRGALFNLMHNRHLIIYCRPKDEVILKNDGREQMEGVLENHLAIIKRYDTLMDALIASNSVEVVEYDYTGWDAAYQAVLRACRLHLQQVAHFHKIMMEL